MTDSTSEKAARKRELREDFVYCDTDRDGRIDYAEFCTLLHHLDAGMSGTDLRIGFYAVDTNHDGVIDFPEFQAWWNDR